MTFSSLISRTVPHHNKFSSRQGRPVTYIVPHHWASTADNSGIQALTNPNRDASVHYFITTYGEIIGQVPEEYRAWTSGSWEADAGAITFEIQNISGQTAGNDMDPNSWKVSDKAFNAAVALVADIAKRYKWGSVARTRIRGHREFAPTACPGGYLWANYGRMAANAHAKLTGGSSSGGGSTPTPPPTNNTGKTVWQLADEVMAGVHGNGDARKRSLGNMYAAVQAEVDRRYGVGKKAATKSVAQLADEVMAGVHGNGADRQKSLGSNYAAVQAEVNRRLGAGGRAPSANVPNISQLADRAIRGDFGNGDARRKALGSNYAAVQAEINRRYGV